MHLEPESSVSADFGQCKGQCIVTMRKRSFSWAEYPLISRVTVCVAVYAAYSVFCQHMYPAGTHAPRWALGLVVRRLLHGSECMKVYREVNTATVLPVVLVINAGQMTHTQCIAHIALQAMICATMVHSIVKTQKNLKF